MAPCDLVGFLLLSLLSSPLELAYVFDKRFESMMGGAYERWRGKEASSSCFMTVLCFNITLRVNGNMASLS